MAAWRRAIELSLGDADVERLRSIAQSRTEPASRVERARILLAYREDPSFFAVGRALGLHHQTVQRCVERAVVEGPMAALDDRPASRSGTDDHARSHCAPIDRLPPACCAARTPGSKPSLETGRRGATTLRASHGLLLRIPGIADRCFD